MEVFLKSPSLVSHYLQVAFFIITREHEKYYIKMEHKSQVITE